MKTLKPPEERVDYVMTNLDHSIEDGMEEALRDREGEVHAEYTAWNFHACVWFENGMFHAEVCQFHRVVAIVSEPTLEAIMITVSDEYGWD